MHRLRRPTELDRATVTQEFRRVVAPEADAATMPKGQFRRLQVLVPATPGIVAVILPDKRFPNVTNLARAAGANRVYKGAPLPPGAQIQFDLGPDQELWAAALDGFGTLSIVTQYFSNEPST